MVSSHPSAAEVAFHPAPRVVQNLCMRVAAWGHPHSDLSTSRGPRLKIAGGPWSVARPEGPSTLVICTHLRRGQHVVTNPGRPCGPSRRRIRIQAGAQAAQAETPRPTNVCKTEPTMGSGFRRNGNVIPKRVSCSMNEAGRQAVDGLAPRLRIPCDIFLWPCRFRGLRS